VGPSHCDRTYLGIAGTFGEQSRGGRDFLYDLARKVQQPRDELQFNYCEGINVDPRGKAYRRRRKRKLELLCRRVRLTMWALGSLERE